MALSLLILILSCVGCERSSNAPASSFQPAVQRFESFGTVLPEVALDTRTGQLCKTWNWGISDVTAQVEKRFGTLNGCVQLYLYDLPLEPPSDRNGK